MCKKLKGCGRRIDKCLIGCIATLEMRDFKIVACCCGHGKYPTTIIYKGRFGGYFDLLSGKEIPERRKIYKKDKQGYYYIPEVSKEK
jgi:hypothetical protein